MVIQSSDSADVVRVRLQAWSKEWRESHLLPEVRALGHLSWPLRSDGESRYQYVVHPQWPLHAFRGIITVTIEENAEGTYLRCALDVRPSVRTILKLALAFAVVAAGYDAITSKFTVLSLTFGAGAFLLVFVTLIVLRPIAASRLNPTVSDVVALLRSALATAPSQGTP
jgi:hypothetical protein